jgi:hypothetical protein
MAIVVSVVVQANIESEKSTKSGQGYRAVREIIPKDGSDATLVFSNAPQPARG